MQNVLLKNRGEFLIFHQEVEMLIASALLPHNRALPSPPHLPLISLWPCSSSPKHFLTLMLCQSILLLLVLPALTNAPLGFFPLANFFHFWVTPSARAGPEDETIPNIPIFQNFHYLSELPLKVHLSTFWAHLSLVKEALSCSSGRPKHNSLGTSSLSISLCPSSRRRAEAVCTIEEETNLQKVDFWWQLSTS